MTRFSAFSTLRVTTLVAVLAGGLLPLAHGQTPTFTDMVVFGDSLSDVGNVANRAQSQYGIAYPSPDFNYTQGSFTDGHDTDPAARSVIRVWHEQLAQKFLKIKRLNDSLDGGQDYAFGGAKTIDGTTDRTVISEGPFQSSLTIDNMGKQVNDYLAANAAVDKTNTLFIVWGGGNDLFDDPSDASVVQTANNVGGLVSKLAMAGARSFIVPNVPPLGMVPQYNMTGQGATDRNVASASYKDQLNMVLDQTIASLQQNEGIAITVYRLDVYSMFLDFIAKPAAFGYQNVTDSSQGLAVDPDKYVFWDGIHPTTNGHDYIADAAYSLISGQPVVSVTAVTSEVAGGDPSVSFYLTEIGGDASADLIVPYTVTGTATAGTDYQGLKGMRKIKAGKTTAQVKLQTFANPALKSAATVQLTLGAGDGYTVGGLKKATITIDAAK